MQRGPPVQTQREADGELVFAGGWREKTRTSLSPMPPLSGLQREVLSLYRRTLRVPRTKPPTTRTRWSIMLRYTFRIQAARAKPTEFSTVEYLLRAGRRQVDMFADPSVKDCQVSAAMHAWDEEDRRRR
ncbi:hypothetical protein MKEN_00918100 [Mycena kentingensis (nom. inval.)]|nr:hypothetical protein MKEN_00918100 [Mycena kentingensis (nom. inval.)]